MDPDEPQRVSPAGRLTGNRFLRFLAVGAFNSAVGYAIYAVLVLFGLLPELALFLATVIGILVSFRTTGRVVFGSRDDGLIVRYIAVYGAVYAVNAVLLRLLIGAGLSPFLAQALLLPVTVVVTFLAMRRFVFAGRGG